MRVKTEQSSFRAKTSSLQICQIKVECLLFLSLPGFICYNFFKMEHFLIKLR